MWVVLTLVHIEGLAPFDLSREITTLLEQDEQLGCTASSSFHSDDLHHAHKRSSPTRAYESCAIRHDTDKAEPSR